MQHRPRDTREERSSPPLSGGLGESRLRQLRADLALTPTERVRAAEETARVSLLLRPRAGRVIGFDRYVDYLEWKRLEELGA